MGCYCFCAGLTAHDMLVDKECEEVEVHYAANQEVRLSLGVQWSVARAVQ